MPKLTTISSRPSRWFALLAVALMAGALLVVTGCGKRGPAEKTGEKVDEAVDGVKDALTPDGPAEKAGEKVDDALGN